jgi:hypothetical protein
LLAEARPGSLAVLATYVIRLPHPARKAEISLHPLLPFEGEDMGSGIRRRERIVPESSA